MPRWFSRKEVGRLAALSRAYHEEFGSIQAALTQELDLEVSSEWRRDVAEYFGMTVEQAAALQVERVKAVYGGYVHRAGLAGSAHVYARILQEVATGHLKPGDQLPPRTRFTQIYNCNKKTHAETIDRLMRNGIVHRPGGKGGPLFIV